MGAANGSAGIDAGQRMLLEGELKIDGEQGAGGSEGGSGSGSGSGLKDEEPTVWCGVLSIRFYQQARGMSWRRCVGGRVRSGCSRFILSARTHLL